MAEQNVAHDSKPGNAQARTSEAARAEAATIGAATIGATNGLDRCGVVIIGRNEARHLRSSLKPARDLGLRQVYVDSGSSDDSIEVARSFGCEIVSLDSTSPFSAARARNEGFERLMARWPDLETVHFIDGDCVLEPDWIPKALATLHSDPSIAIVVGLILERYPKASPFNSLIAMEWNSPPGLTDNPSNATGTMLVRTALFRDVKGFNPRVIAGEDTDFIVRVMLREGKMWRMADHMATHDAGLSTFSAWWKRCVRSGHAIGHRAALNGDTSMKDGVRARRSVILWAWLLPAAALLLAIPTHGLSLLLLALGYALLGYRIYRYRRGLGSAPAESRLYARYITLAKFAEGIGLAKYYLNRARGEFRLIEYR